MESNSIRWETVERWTSLLIDRDYREIRAAFTDDGVAAPRIVWSPVEADLPTPPMLAAHRHWTGLQRTGAAPHHGAIDPQGFVPALGFVNILETIPGSRDLRYRLFGSAAARISGFDMTGRLQSQHPASRYVTEFALACSNACIARREPLFAEREPARAQRTVRWPRLLLPLSGDCGGIVRILSVTVPLDAAGDIVR